MGWPVEEDPKKIHSIQPPFCLFFDRPIFFCYSQILKNNILLLFAWPKQLPKPANIFYIHTSLSYLQRCAFRNRAALSGCLSLQSSLRVLPRDPKNYSKRIQRYVFGHLITARSLEVMIFLWCWDILGVILLPNNGNVHRFDPLAFVLDQ